MENDKATHKTISIIKKYKEEIKEGESLKDFEFRCFPYKEDVIEGNALIEAGVDIMWSLTCGGAGTAYNAANSNIHIYITSAWDTSGTFDSGNYPTFGSDGKAVWKASWSGTDGDGPWSKWAVSNGTQRLNEKTQDLGTKDGGTWTLEVSITIT